MTVVQLISKPGSTSTGIGRYVVELERGLNARDIEVYLARLRTLVPPGISDVVRKAGYDLEAFLSSYPIRAATRRADVTHITSQTLGSLLITQRLTRPVMVTVHDILPYMLRHDPALRVYQNAAHRLMDALAMRGLKRADRIVADSFYSRECLISTLRIPGDRIRVAHLGIDHETFRQLDVPGEFRARYDLSPDKRYIIYVGSEDPRKNLGMLIEALAIVRRTRTNVELLKVGRAHFEQERTRLRHLAGELDVRAAFRILDDVPEADLPFLYNAADICAMPSRYEGFGFPVLEAMACGTPVVCSNRTSLPELAGDAALQFDPDTGAAAQLAAQIDRVLGDQDLSCSMRQRGARQAAGFTWPGLLDRMLEIYRTPFPEGRHHVKAIRRHKWL